MSGKFMRVKRIVIPTITMVMIASQLMGCSAATSSELMTMVQNNEAIEIEIAEPINQEQGTESEIVWEELALLKENPDLRKGWDNALGISAIENGKNGMLYVNEKGEQTNNNTLYVALHNRQFQKALEGDTKALVEAAVNSYADLESVSDDDKEVAVLMGINGYFNLLPDSTPNYSNPDSTIERNEFMAMLYRANNPVKELTEDKSFSGMVGDNKYNIYAQGSLSSSYLDTISKSLDNLTYNGTITRAEAVYAVVQTYFADEYKNVDINASAYSDCKNGGNIAQSAIDKTKKADSLSEVDHWKSYELTYALQNPDTVGMPIDLYKAMIIAKQKGLIDGGTSRWDEGLTKAEAIDIIVRAIEQDDSMETFDVMRASIGNMDVEVILENESDNSSSVSVDSTGVDATFEEGEERGEAPDNIETSEVSETVSQEDTSTSKNKVRDAGFTVDDFEYDPSKSDLFEDGEEEMMKELLQSCIDAYEAGEYDYYTLMGVLADLGIDNTKLIEDYRKNHSTSNTTTSQPQQETTYNPEDYGLMPEETKEAIVPQPLHPEFSDTVVW